MIFALTIFLAASLAELKAALQPVASVACRVVQTKASPLFKQALKTEGELWVLPRSSGGGAAMLRIDTLAGGARTSFAVNGGEAAFKSKEGVQRLPLGELPQAQRFLTAFGDFFTGRLGALAETFTAEVTGGPLGYTLTLTPKGDDAAALKQATLTFARATKAAPLVLERITLAEQNGDSSVIQLERCVFDKTLSPDLFVLK